LFLEDLFKSVLSVSSFAVFVGVFDIEHPISQMCRGRTICRTASILDVSTRSINLLANTRFIPARAELYLVIYSGHLQQQSLSIYQLFPMFVSHVEGSQDLFNT